MNMKFFSKKIIYSFILSLFLIFSISNYSFAENTPGFSVEAILPDTQLDESKNLSYFDFLITRNEPQELKVKVTNSSTSSITINAQLNNASTNKYGVIEYSKNTNDGTTFNTLFSDIATLNKTSTTLQGGESDEFIITINSTGRFNGAILGGIKLHDATNGNNTSTSSGITVKNEFAYVIAIKAQQSTTPISPSVSISKFVTPTNATDTTLYAELRNDFGVVLTGLNININVTNRDTNRVVLKNEFKDYCLAPSSLFDFHFADGKFLSAGKYTMNITMSGGSLTDDIYINYDFDLTYPKPTNSNLIRSSSNDVSMNKNTKSIEKNISNDLDKSNTNSSFAIALTSIISISGVSYLMYRSGSKSSENNNVNKDNENEEDSDNN